MRAAAILIVVPLIIGYVISRSLAEPTFVLMERFNPEFFELSDRQKVEGAHEVHVHELRLRMGASIGRAPPLDGEQNPVTPSPIKPPDEVHELRLRTGASVGRVPPLDGEQTPCNPLICVWAPLSLVPLL